MACPNSEVQTEHIPSKRVIKKNKKKKKITTNLQIPGGERQNPVRPNESPAATQTPSQTHAGRDRLSGTCSQK